MTYAEALNRKIDGDLILVAKMCGITRANASVITRRPKSKKHQQVMDALIKVIESREVLLSGTVDFQI
jgi:hypothetical protein